MEDIAIPFSCWVNLDPFHLPLTRIFNCTLYNKLIVQSMITNPHKNQTMIFNISYHNFYGLGIYLNSTYGDSLSGFLMGKSYWDFQL